MIAVRPFRAPQPPPRADRFERSAPVEAPLARSYAALSWADPSNEKLRLLGAMAKLKTEAAADAVMQAWADAAPGLPELRRAGLARIFQTLTVPGALPQSKREQVIAVVLKAFQAAPAGGDVHLQLGYALALANHEGAADALIAHYKRSPATGAETIHRGLRMLSFCPHPKVSAFLAGEHERLAGNPDARTQVLATLLEQLDR